jgi:hypothetical protein
MGVCTYLWGTMISISPPGGLHGGLDAGVDVGLLGEAGGRAYP